MTWETDYKNNWSVAALRREMCERLYGSETMSDYTKLAARIVDALDGITDDGKAIAALLETLRRSPTGPLPPGAHRTARIAWLAELLAAPASGWDYIPTHPGEWVWIRDPQDRDTPPWLEQVFAIGHDPTAPDDLRGLFTDSVGSIAAHRERIADGETPDYVMARAVVTSAPAVEELKEKA